MTAGCVLGCGWRENKLLQKCAWAGGQRLGRIDLEGESSVWDCDVPYATSAKSPPELSVLRGGIGCAKDAQILLNPGPTTVKHPSPSLPSTEEDGENPLTFL